MAVARINPNNPIIYGGSAITPAPNPGSGYNAFYTSSARDISIPDASSLGFYQEINGRYLADEWVLQGGILASGGDTAAPTGVNMDAVVYYGAPGQTRHNTILGVGWGYDAAPSSGVISVESPSGTPIWGPFPVTTSGTTFEDFAKGLKAPANTELLVKLKAVSGAHGVVTAKGHHYE